MQKAEKSCGAVVFRLENGARLYLILHYNEGHWDFAKGHVEPGESEEETAMREIHEETGLSSLGFVEGFRESITYTFKREGRGVPKEVVLFIVITPEKEVALSSEHQGFAWLPYAEAEKRLTYKNAKEMLKKAEGKLSSS